MSPDAQTIGVGGTVVFAVSVSGGVAGEAASWTCASSDPSKATVSVIPVGCQATAVAAGGTSITAVVTKGGATTNAGAGLTITEDMVESAFMALASIEDSDDDAEVLSGKVSVTLNVERGDETLMQLSVLVDGGCGGYPAFWRYLGGGGPAGRTGAAAGRTRLRPVV